MRMKRYQKHWVQNLGCCILHIALWFKVQSGRCQCVNVIWLVEDGRQQWSNNNNNPPKIMNHPTTKIHQQQQSTNNKNPPNTTIYQQQQSTNHNNALTTSLIIQTQDGVSQWTVFSWIKTNNRINNNDENLARKVSVREHYLVRRNRIFQKISQQWPICLIRKLMSMGLSIQSNVIIIWSQRKQLGRWHWLSNEHTY